MTALALAAFWFALAIAAGLATAAVIRAAESAKAQEPGDVRSEP